MTKTLQDRLRAQAKRISDTTKWLSGQRPGRQHDGGIYVGLEPEQTLEWEAAIELDRLSAPVSVSERATMTETLQDKARNFATVISVDSSDMPFRDEAVVRLLRELADELDHLKQPEQSVEIPCKGFIIGDQVEKFTGDYHLTGEVRADFTTRAGKRRYVVEHEPGFLHIYSDTNLRPVLACLTTSSTKPKES